MEPAAGSTTLYIANRNLRPSSTRSLHDFCLWIDGTTSMPTWTMQRCRGHAMTRSLRSNPGENCSVSHTRVVALHSPLITNSTSAYNYPKKKSSWIFVIICHTLQPSCRLHFRSRFPRPRSSECQHPKPIALDCTKSQLGFGTDPLP